MLLVVITLMGLALGIAGSSWSTLTQRAKEEDLLWKGNQIRKAIGDYYTTAKVGGKTVSTFPENLEALTLDPRMLETTRYLRKIYIDPMTGEDWQTIPAPGGGIMGVYSASNKKPFKQNDFIDENKGFVGKQTYREWQFIYTPQTKTTSGNTTDPKKSS